MPAPRLGRIHAYIRTLRWRSVGHGALIGFNMLCFGHMFVDYVARIGFMYGPSMLPTFAATGDVVLEDRLSVRLGRPFARGDLITFVSPANPAHIVCKRVLGLPGDIVCVDPTGTVAPSDEHVVIPRGHIWVQGDNADNSRDSRYYGPLSMGLVRGFVYARVLPFSTAKIFRGERNATYLD